MKDIKTNQYKTIDKRNHSSVNNKRSNFLEIIEYAIKHYSLVQTAYRNVMSFVFNAVGTFTKTDKYLVLLSSMSGDQYSDSPKVLFEAMKKDPRYKRFHYIWAFKNPDQFEVVGADKVKIDTFKYFRDALKAKVWITNVNIERGLKFKKKGTVYLNTWHGTGPKKGGNAVKGRNDYDFSYVDIVCVDGKYARDEMVNWFNAQDKNLLWCGRPREDELFTFTEQTAIFTKKELGIPDDKKVLLYMPTWREYGNMELETEKWEKRLGDQYVMLVRSHHFSKQKLTNKKNNFWIDVSDYPDVNRLYYIADILISDYSSAFFDYGLLGKPMICFGYDYEQYAADNGFLMDLKNEFPSGIKRSEDEVIDFILSMNYEAESRRCKEYCDGYVNHPGNATKACLDRIYEIIRNDV